MNLDRVIKGWEAVGKDNILFLEERIPHKIAMAQGGRPRIALGALDSDVMTPLFARPAWAAAHLGVLAPWVEPAIRDEERFVLKYAERDGLQPATAPVSYVSVKWGDLANALECVGHPIDPAGWETLRGWLPRSSASRDDEFVGHYWNIGYAGLALDVPAAVKRIAGLDPSHPVPFEPGAQFQFNMQARLRHYIGALQNKASLVDILPAWEEFLEMFHPMRTADSVNHATLLWIARLTFHTIGGLPLGEVAQHLHDSAYRLAGREP